MDIGDQLIKLRNHWVGEISYILGCPSSATVYAGLFSFLFSLKFFFNNSSIQGALDVKCSKYPFLHSFFNQERTHSL